MRSLLLLLCLLLLLARCSSSVQQVVRVRKCCPPGMAMDADERCAEEEEDDGDLLDKLCRGGAERSRGGRGGSVCRGAEDRMMLTWSEGQEDE